MVWLPLRFVREKLDELEPIVALTLYGPPARLFAVTNELLAMPFGSVVTDSVLELVDANVAVEPVEGAWNVTVVPGAGLPVSSLTRAWRVAWKVVLMAVLWPLPEFTVIV